MKVLIIGGGGREHALAWKLKQSPKVEEVFVAPGNAGTEKIAKNIPLNNANDILNWVKENPVDLVVVGPDDFLAEGMIDRLQEINVPAFGPTKLAAEIEWSKSFAKNFMKNEGIPTARYEIFNDAEKAKEYIKRSQFPLVIKASGLALGKGVIIAQDIKEAELALNEIMIGKIFNNAGNEVVIEEYLEGIEISTHAFCDGDTAIMFPAAQDHKRILEGDKGPNTGGMGTVAPVTIVTAEQMEEIRQKIVLPTLQALKRMGRPLKGILFPGIMLTKEGPKVIEFNVRFGDPEAQSYMRILETDLADIFLGCINGKLPQSIKWSDKFACCVVLASGGYPANYEKGIEIAGLDRVQSPIEVFHAGTMDKNNGVITSGGRVLGVSAVGNSLEEALDMAYDGIKLIHFDGMQFRKDIGAKLKQQISSQ